MSPAPDSTLDDPQQIIADLRRTNGELQRRLDEAFAERDEALKQQTATAEVLQVINSSPGDLAPVFDTMLDKAFSLCGATYGSLQVYGGGRFRAVAVRGLPEAFAAFLREGFLPNPKHPQSGILRGKRFVQILDMAVLDVPGSERAVKRLNDIVAGRFDAGIRVGERLEKDMIAVRLTPDVEMTAVASPDYLARHGEPKTPTDLHRHVCINWRFPGSGALHRWGFEKRGNKLEIGVEGALISNHQEIVVEGALQGLGILYAYDDERIHGLIIRGQLKRVLTDWSVTLPGLFLYYSNRRLQQPALRAFIDCLLDRNAT